MADHLTEEEQIEAIKSWWKENWLSIVLPIVLVGGAYLAWDFWTDQKVAKAEAASDQYALIIDQVSQAQQSEMGAELSDEQKQSISEAAKTLIEDYPKSRYARLSELMLAKLAVESNEYDAAISSLESVVENAKDVALAELAKARLAKVYLASGDADKALSVIPANISDANKTLFSEIKGDIYVAKGETALANTAYQTAIDSLPSDQFSRRGLLSLKLNNTKVESANAAATDSEATSDDAAAEASE